jgi:hypothetical protein
MCPPAPLRRVTAAALACALLLAGCAAPTTDRGERAALPPPPVTDAAFCRDAQRDIVTTALGAENEVITVLDAFVKSKPVVRPLQTRQFVWMEDGAAGTETGPTGPARPKMVSCKMKTADHLVAEFGAGAAGADIGCSGVNRLTLERVLAAMTPAERRRLRFKPQQVVFDEDFVTALGPVWLEPYPIARLGEDRRLHIQARAMRNDWLDPRYAAAPPQFRGTRYCHLIAPEHLARLLRGEVSPAAAATPAP